MRNSVPVEATQRVSSLAFGFLTNCAAMSRAQALYFRAPWPAVQMDQRIGLGIPPVALEDGEGDLDLLAGRVGAVLRHSHRPALEGHAVDFTLRHGERAAPQVTSG